jgi:hypothetical protein
VTALSDALDIDRDLADNVLDLRLSELLACLRDEARG